MTNKLANHQTVLLLFGLFFAELRSAHRVRFPHVCKQPCLNLVSRMFRIFSFKDVQPGLFFIRIFRVLNTVQSFIFKVQLVASVLSSNSFILSQLVAFVKNFFNFFYFSFFQSFLMPFGIGSRVKKIIIWNWAEKEGFEPSRRLPDLHP